MLCRTKTRDLLRPSTTEKTTLNLLMKPKIKWKLHVLITKINSGYQMEALNTRKITENL